LRVTPYGTISQTKQQIESVVEDRLRNSQTSSCREPRKSAVDQFLPSNHFSTFVTLHFTRYRHKICFIIVTKLKNGNENMKSNRKCFLNKSLYLGMSLFGVVSTIYSSGCVKSKSNSRQESFLLANKLTGAETLVLVEPVPIYQNPKDPNSRILWQGHCYLISHIDGTVVSRRNKNYRDNFDKIEPEFRNKLKQYFSSGSQTIDSTRASDVSEILDSANTYEALYRHLPTLRSPLPEGSNFPVNPVAMHLFARTFFESTSLGIANSDHSTTHLKYQRKLRTDEGLNLALNLFLTVPLLLGTHALVPAAPIFIVGAPGFLGGALLAKGMLKDAIDVIKKSKSITAESQKKTELQNLQAAAGAAFLASLKHGLESDRFLKSPASHEEVKGAGENFKEILLAFFDEAKSENIILKIGEQMQDDVSLSARISLLDEQARAGEIDYFSSENCPRDSSDSIALRTLLQ
jgi:hypothetical protein